TVARGLSPTSLASLLASQKDAIAKAAPAGLANALGLHSLTDLGAVADSIKSAGVESAHRVGRAAVTTASQGTEGLRWAAPLGLLAAVLAGLYFWPRGQGEAPLNTVQGPDIPQAAKPATDAARRAGERVASDIKDTAKHVTDEGKVLIETARQNV